jgi:hypothetical protein
MPRAAWRRADDIFQAVGGDFHRGDAAGWACQNQAGLKHDDFGRERIIL